MQKFVSLRSRVPLPEACPLSTAEERYQAAFGRLLDHPTPLDANVSVRSKSVLTALKRDFRHTSESRHSQCWPACLKGAILGLMRRSKQRRYSITSSARVSSVGDISRPSAKAVFRLTTRSNLRLDPNIGRLRSAHNLVGHFGGAAGHIPRVPVRTTSRLQGALTRSIRLSSSPANAST